jgi:TPR repeat protein
MLAAKGGDSEAQNELGAAYANGAVVVQNYAEAAKWYLAAAEQNNGWAQRNLAKFYRDGIGVRKDVVEASKWLDLASANGSYLLSYAAKDERAALEKQMSATQINEAQARASKWKPKLTALIKSIFLGAGSGKMCSLVR